MTETVFDSFLQNLREFDTASVVTRSKQDMLIGRPMAIADCTAAGHLWFITRVESSTVRDITDNPQIAACMQSNGRYVSISGYPRTTRDKQRVDRIWDPRQAAWFDKGRDDPSLILLEIVPAYGEYWDRTGGSGIDFKFREMRAMVTGSTFEETAPNHGLVDFSGSNGDS